MKEKILYTVEHLIQKYGVKKFTIDDIALELKISKKTIYKYFNSKEDIIKSYFDTTIASDKASVLLEMNSSKEFLDKIHGIIYSNHQYKMPMSMVNELKVLYPEVWMKIRELKEFKVNEMMNLLKQAMAEGVIKTDVNFGVLSRMLEEVSDMFIDYDFLMENRLKTQEAIDEALKIIFNGILV